MLGAIKSLIEKILNIKFEPAEKLQVNPQILFTAVSSYFSIASFGHFLVYNTIGFRMRMKLICDAIKSSKISQLSSLHIQLCESIKLFSEIFPFHIAILVFFSVISFAFSLYEIYFAIINNANDNDQLVLCIVTNIWNLMLALSILIIFHFCTNVKNEGEKVFIKLTKEFGRVEDEKVRNKIWIFMMQTQHLKPCVGNEFYIFEWKLLLHVRILLNFYLIYIKLFSVPRINFIVLNYGHSIWTNLSSLINFQSKIELK